MRGNRRDSSRGGGRYSRRGGGGGGRSQHSRGGGSRRGSRGGRYGRGGGYSRRGSEGNRDPRMVSDSGNKKERVTIESGNLVLIDQYMLANGDFLSKLDSLIDSDPTLKDNLVRDYGGLTVKLGTGTFRIERDPFAFSILLYPEEADMRIQQSTEENNGDKIGELFLDTRCIVMIDRELLDDSSLLRRYQELWQSGQDKACRDLLRDNGGAVRYGFTRLAENLGVYLDRERNVVSIWSDTPPSKLEDEPANPQSGQTDSEVSGVAG
ncbi:MAG TPA: hypothetical protein PKD37_04665 [Oligoflexia bacterium]|nr:hypothetical protein [Oligoflexia bacterium]HMP27257.1 hypothetical protein [Oligoflexia bacterium]